MSGVETEPGVLVLAATPIGRVADAPPRLAEELADAEAAGAATTPELLDQIAGRHAMDVVGPVPDGYL